MTSFPDLSAKKHEFCNFNVNFSVSFFLKLAKSGKEESEDSFYPRAQSTERLFLARKSEQLRLLLLLQRTTVKVFPKASVTFLFA